MPALADVLAEVLPIQVADDGALTVRHDDTVASVREVTIADGLDMLSLSQLLAWDLPATAELREHVVAQANTTVLGNVTLVERPDGCADVLLRYHFPVGGLDARALQTLILIVLAGGAEVRRALVG
jgi:hypothetical protein